MLIKFVINKDLVLRRKRPGIPCYSSLIRISAIIKRNESKLLNYFIVHTILSLSVTKEKDPR